MQSMCSSCGSDGCVEYGVGGGNARQYQGTSIEGGWLSLAPEEVSTLLVSYDSAAATSTASIIAHGDPGYANAIGNVVAPLDFMPQMLDLNALVHPALTDYYLRPKGAPGCTLEYPQPECSTIFEGNHNPILSIPSQLSILQGDWATCLPAIYGVYDPPMALTETTVLEGPSRYPGHQSTNEGASPTTYQADPVNSPSVPTPHATSGGDSAQKSSHDDSETDNGRYTFNPPHIEQTETELNTGGYLEPTKAPHFGGNSGFGGGSSQRGGDGQNNASPGQSSQGTIIRAGNRWYTVSREGADAIRVNGATVTRGSDATTIDGQQVTADGSMIKIGDQSISFDAVGRVKAGAIITQGDDKITVSQDASGTNVYVAGGSIRLTVGGSAQTLGGITLSAASGGVVHDGSTVSLASISGTTSSTDRGTTNPSLTTPIKVDQSGQTPTTTSAAARMGSESSLGGVVCMTLAVLGLLEFIRLS